MTPPSPSPLRARAEALIDQLEDGIQDSENGTLYLADNAIDIVMKWAEALLADARVQAGEGEAGE